MMRTTTFWRRSVLGFLAVVAFGSLAGQTAAEKPNVLFIFADDQCFETIRALGNDEIETPNLDRLARSGVTFTHAYNMGSWSGAVCVASRTMLNTGRTVWRANSVYKSAEKERQAGRFWSEHMKHAGYRTYFTGKWHVPANPEKAFDVARHVRGGMPNQTEAGYNRPLADRPDSWSPYDPRFGGFWQGGKHWSEVVGDDGVDYLTMAANDDQPFFMYLAFNAPHDPRQSPKEFVDKYPADKIRVPVNYQSLYPFKDGIGCGPGLRDEKLAPFPRTEHAVQVHRQEYYAIITHMDVQIGRILDALEKSGQADNTYIFFSADHGLAVGQHGLMGKQNMYDHSVRVPLMVVGPNVPAGERIDEPVYLQDIMATSLALAEVEKPAHVEFHSLMPMIRDGAKSPYDAVYGAYLGLQRMVTADGYKLILYPQIKRARLYHVAEDPREMHDLADDEKATPIARRLFAKLLDLQERYDDSLDLPAAFPKLAAK
ncbi:MAG: sulfatase-like hydrolase/transferase, partial [Planctomycetales bacterium]|nr:sulfatase-like hydrolase/transferase [Planctomycetales bacterium]